MVNNSHLLIRYSFDHAASKYIQKYFSSYGPPFSRGNNQKQEEREPFVIQGRVLFASTAKSASTQYLRPWSGGEVVGNERVNCVK